jgi:hypothetical protein
VRLLHERKWEPKLIREFFLVIDWMMELPPVLSSRLNHFVTALEEERKMEYVSSIERIRLQEKLDEAIQLGLSQGEKVGVQVGESTMLYRLLKRCFGELSQELHERIKNASQAQIEIWFDRGMDATTLDAVFQEAAH